MGGRGRGGGGRGTSGHDLAASTNSGRKLTCPSTVRMTESPSTNSSSPRPSCLLSPAWGRSEGPPINQHVQVDDLQTTVQSWTPDVLPQAEIATP